MYNIHVLHYIGYFPFNVSKIQDATGGGGTTYLSGASVFTSSF